MKIIALDPGGTTGWATWEDSILGSSESYGEGRNVKVPYGDTDITGWFSYGQLGPNEHHLELETLLGLEHSEHDYTVVCESFQYRSGIVAQYRPNLVLDSVEYIGVVKYFVQDRGLAGRLYMQTASAAKDFITDDKLKRLNLWIKGQQHARDALRHLCFWLIKHRQSTEGKFLMDQLKATR